MVYDLDGDGYCDVCGERTEEECGCTSRDLKASENGEIEYYGN